MTRLTNVVIAALIGVSCCTPAPILAQEMERVPKIEWERCGDFACLDFEETKNLARMRAQYTFLFDLVPTLRSESAAWQKAAENSMMSARFSREAYDRLFTVYTTQKEVIQKSIEARDRAETLSIFGDAMPYVIVFGVICFAGGVWLGASTGN